MAQIKETVVINDIPHIFETGRLAKQAGGSVLARAGDTLVLVTAVVSKSLRPGIDFFPMSVDYQEKLFAAGRIPGGFFKREGKARDEEILVSRLIDRSIRPLFPEGYKNEVQIIANVLSADNVHDSEMLALTAASAALSLCGSPFMGPIAGVRVCRVGGKFVANATAEQRKKADIEMVVACSKDAIMMVEGGADEATEADLVEALFFAHKEAQPLIEMQHKILNATGKKRSEFVPPPKDEALQKKVEAAVKPLIIEAYKEREKIKRYGLLDEAKKSTIKKLVEAEPTLAGREGEMGGFVEDLKYDLVRKRTVAEGVRIDGRKSTDIRAVTCEAGLLPRTHGSALFQRGETQGLVVTTLGTKQDEQRIENLLGASFRNFMLQYNFPPYSVGEVKPLRGPGRREVGHGALAERAITRVWNKMRPDDFPYTIRIVSEILESNGSSSMATVCGTSLAMMDAGLPLKKHVAGIAMGLIKEDGKIAVLSDILGDEDHLGDMDFKVCGTDVGVTAIQMDIKIAGLDRAIITQALNQAKEARLFILGKMNETLSAPRAEMSQFAPRITTIRIKQDRIKDVIGPGGKVIKDIVAKTGCQVDVNDDGKVNVSSSDPDAVKRALKMINDLTQEAEVGKVYLGTVSKIVEFGAFIEIFPGTDGLCHISELSEKRVKEVGDVLQEGDEVLVKVIGVDSKSGKIKLSRKEAANEKIEDYKDRVA
ncbi:MAG: polyribonucleotide nucleotidyltransferase [Deltaproteobacteria bacterium]|nr:polyribonucleotide nucleotidyltransferase [Deltaproteobacteria bacterium]